jgi:hypothetical protein
LWIATDRASTEASPFVGSYGLGVKPLQIQAAHRNAAKAHSEEHPVVSVHQRKPDGEPNWGQAVMAEREVQRRNNRDEYGSHAERCPDHR